MEYQNTDLAERIERIRQINKDMEVCADVYGENHWEKTPRDTIDTVIDRIGEARAKTALAVLCNLADYYDDGRVYPAEKAWAKTVTDTGLDPTRDKRLEGEPYERIHKTHLHQLAEEMMGREKGRTERKQGDRER